MSLSRAAIASFRSVGVGGVPLGVSGLGSIDSVSASPGWRPIGAALEPADGWDWSAKLAGRQAIASGTPDLGARREPDPVCVFGRRLTTTEFC